MVGNRIDSPVDLPHNVLGNAIPLRVPALGNLPSNKTVELDCLGQEDTRAPLEFDFPLAALQRPGIYLVALLALEAAGVLR